jgi:hypothetical protein
VVVKLYTIAWRSKTTGAEGEGTMKMSKDVGKRWIKRLNRDEPELEHYLKEAPE